VVAQGEEVTCTFDEKDAALSVRMISLSGVVDAAFKKLKRFEYFARLMVAIDWLWCSTWQ
jgi:hypothetical protein